MRRILLSPNIRIGKLDTVSWRVDEILLKEELKSFSLPKEDQVLLFIPTIFDSSIAIDYDGVDIALRLYMEAIRNNHTDVGIVLMGVESRESFLLNYRFPSIVKCPGVDYIRLNKLDVIGYMRDLMISDIEIGRESLKLLGLTLPSSYISNHSFVNEWSAYMWSEYMGFNCDKLRNIISSNLYFDYLRTIISDFRNDRVTSERIRIINNLSGRVLLIDDNEYWHEFFTKFFENTNVQFKGIGKSFRFTESKKIVEECLHEISDFKPDIILLDFRLNEDADSRVVSRKDISGIQVLRSIKKISPTNIKNVIELGRKVVLFTATGKIDHIFALQRFGADAFIFKDAPGKYPGKSTTKESVNKLITCLDRMNRNAKLSIKICESLVNWKLSCEQFYDDEYDEFKKFVDRLIENIERMLQGDIIEILTLKRIFLECFSVLEHLKPRRSDRINDFIQNTFPSELLGEWNNINNIRNSLAHADDYTSIDNRSVMVDESIMESYIVKLCCFNQSILSFIANS